MIATGNQLPRNPAIANMDFYSSPNYFRNPWNEEAVNVENENLPVLIVGNGLTMADTVLGLLEKGFNGHIVSISPNGLNLLPHELSEQQNNHLLNNFVDNLPLHEWVNLVRERVNEHRKNGVSAEPLIDAIRPYTQTIWRSLSDKEKALFMSRLRHLWGVARHRIPMDIYEKLQQLRLNGKLTIIAGKLIEIHESNDKITVHFYDKKLHQNETISVSRVINCTGPETDIARLENSFLNSCLQKGIVSQDSLKLGICTNIHTFQVLDDNGVPHPHLFTLGSTLKGELWESTAVNELRTQAEKLAGQLLELIHSNEVKNSL